ncbi:MAG: nucleoside deaminase [Bacteroidales bacterium]|jgi:tRNA(Arg) A34 adenosine deaminase TadA|nr:nucleoside deaminase [Bacteroidales bacterium]
MKIEEFMSEAIKLANESIDNGGGPFGAVIVKNGEIIAKSSNSVTKDNDPTAHAEINAIRQATKKLSTFDLSGCEIYSSCEPCPMCLGAIYWARIEHLYFACNQNDADKIGFSDQFIYKEIEKQYQYRNLKTENIFREEALKVFEKWENFKEKIEY